MLKQSISSRRLFPLYHAIGDRPCEEIAFYWLDRPPGPDDEFGNRLKVLLLDGEHPDHESDIKCGNCGVQVTPFDLVCRSE